MKQIVGIRMRFCSNRAKYHWRNHISIDMGHTRLGTLAATRSWNEVIGLIAEGATAARIAEAVANAWRTAFGKVQGDVGFREAIYWISQLGVAGAEKNPTEYLNSLGLEVGKSQSLVEVAMALSDAMDRRMERSGKRSDFGELAGRALVSAVTENLEGKMRDLFPSTEQVNSAFGKVGKVKEFANLSRNFFQKLTKECLDYFLSKTVPEQVGQAAAFATVHEMQQFGKAMDVHCWEASKIVEQFSGEWMSKNRFEGGGRIPREKAEQFGWYALRKMQLELEARARKNG